MKVVLRSDVDNLGSKGDLVVVADGYARNYLVPRGFAIVATKGAIAQAESMRRSRSAKAHAEREHAVGLATKLSGRTVPVSAKAGDKGRLFGSITAADVVQAVELTQGVTLDRRALDLPDTIKTVGQYEATVRLHADVTATFTIKVIAA